MFPGQESIINVPPSASTNNITPNKKRTTPETPPQQHSQQQDLVSKRPKFGNFSHKETESTIVR
jgi:hypothetical protein